jgi:hypothetical protein
VSEGHRKGHHTHETTDAFAEGWDARARALPNETVKNPYRAEAEAEAAAKALAAQGAPKAVRGPGRPAKKSSARERDIVLWDRGWEGYEEDLSDPT